MFSLARTLGVEHKSMRTEWFRGELLKILLCLVAVTGTIYVSFQHFGNESLIVDPIPIVEEFTNKCSCVTLPGKDSLPTIYIITPTYRRQSQIAELTRLGQTLKLVPNIHWIVAEDASTVNYLALQLIQRMKIPYTYLLAPMPSQFRDDPNLLDKPKGVAGRIKSLQWILKNAQEGVVYFADDDNSYDIRLFEEMRWTQKISIWPVGLLGTSSLTTPVIKNGTFVGWFNSWPGGRTYAVDMASFAFNVALYREKIPEMPFVKGFEEDIFLQNFELKPEDLEFKANGCTEIFVWHTRTEDMGPADKQIFQGQYNQTNLRVLQNNIVY